MTTETINIRIREDGARVVQRNIREIGEEADGAAPKVDKLGSALQLLLGFLAIDQILKYADAWSAASGAIRIATKSAEEAATVQDQLFKVAQKTRTGFTEIVELYSRAQRAGSDLAASQQDIIDFTEGVGKALAVQGTSSTEASGALLQLGQALGGAKIQAQEFNSLIDGAPVVLQTVARGLDEAGGSLGKLTLLVKDGKVTNKEFFDAFMKGMVELDKDFAKTTLTFGQGFTVISNGFMKFLGELDQGASASSAFGTVAYFVAENMQALASGLLAVGAAYLAAQIPTMIASFKALGVVIAANPIVALVLAIVAVTAYIVLMRDEIKVLSDGVTSLGDVFRAIGGIISESFASAYDIVSGAVSSIVDIVGGFVGPLVGPIAEVVGEWADYFTSFFEGTGSGFLGFVKLLARISDLGFGLIGGMIKAVGEYFTGLPTVAIGSFKLLYNGVVGIVEKLTNSIINGINEIRGYFGKDLIETISFEKFEVDENLYSNYGRSIGDAFAKGFEGSKWQESLVDDIATRAQKIGQNRNSKMTGTADLSAALGTGSIAETDDKAAKKARKEFEKLQNEMISLLDKIAPIKGAYLEQEKALATLTKAEEKKIITSAEHAEYLVLLKEYYKDIVDPMGKLQREYEEETRLLGLNTREREIESKVLQTTKELLKDGIRLSGDEIETLRQRIKGMSELNEVTREQDRLLGESVDSRRAVMVQMQAMRNLLNDFSSSFDYGDANLSLVNTSPDLFAGTKNVLDAQVTMFKDAFTKIDAMRDQDLISEATANQMRMQQTELLGQKILETQIQLAQERLELGSGTWADGILVSLGRVTQGFTTFAAGTSELMGGFFDSFTEGFANSVGRAIVYSDSLNEALGNVAREALANLISGLVKLGLQWALNATLGQTVGAAALAAQTAASVAAAGVTAAAWAPAAAAVSLASFGANSAPAIAGMGTAFAVSDVLASLPGFSAGGYTGNGGIGEIAGVVHGKEYVMNAEATARNMPMLERMNKGGSIGGNVSVTIENYGTSKEFEVQQMSETEVRIIARDEAKSVVRAETPNLVSSDLSNANSKISKALTQNTNMQRKRP